MILKKTASLWGAVFYSGDRIADNLDKGTAKRFFKPYAQIVGVVPTDFCFVPAIDHPNLNKGFFGLKVDLNFGAIAADVEDRATLVDGAIIDLRINVTMKAFRAPFLALTPFYGQHIDAVCYGPKKYQRREECCASDDGNFARAQLLLDGRRDPLRPVRGALR